MKGTGLFVKNHNTNKRTSYTDGGGRHPLLWTVQLARGVYTGSKRYPPWFLVACPNSLRSLIVTTFPAVVVVGRGM